MADARFSQPSRERVGFVEMEEGAAARRRIERVREPRLDAGALIEERKWSKGRRQTSRKAGRVFLRLNLDARQRLALALRLNDPYGLAVHVEQIIRVAVAGI